MKRVVVIGGGLAGCAAALELADAGCDVTLLEAKRKLGGRASSFTIASESGERQEVDYCQHVGMGCCSSLIRLIKRLRQESLWRRNNELHFYGPDGDYQRLATLPLMPAPAHLAGWLWKWPGLGFKDRLGIAGGMLRINRLKSPSELDRKSALEWLKEIGQSETAIQRFWETIIVSALGEQIDRVSLDAVRKVMQDGFLRGRDSFHLLVPTRPLSELFGTLMEAALEEAGVTVRLGCRAVQLTTFGGQTAIRLDDESVCEAEQVVIAVPWHQLPSLAERSDLPELDRVAQSAMQLETSPITGVHTWWDQPWLEHPHAAIVGRLCQWVFPDPLATAGEAKNSEVASGKPAYYQIVISSSRELPRGDSRAAGELIIEDLVKVFPQVQQRELLKLQVVTDPRAVFSVRPGVLELRPDARLTDRITLAGDWTHTGWPATMEGAIRSGENAARVVKGWES